MKDGGYGREVAAENGVFAAVFLMKKKNNSEFRYIYIN